MRSIRATHTYVTMAVTPAFHEEVATKLRDAGYDHAFDGAIIDMHGVALVPEAGGSHTPRPATQDWVHGVSIMQQSVLLSAIRGCDGMPKLHKHKPLVKWYRRCVLISAFDKKALTDPFAPGGGSFTGPIQDLRAWLEAAPHPISEYDHRCSLLQKASDDFMDSRDELPAHYTTHFMHAVEILGYKHPDAGIREFWRDFYVRLVHALHLWPETEEQMDKRLGDDLGDWKARGDVSTSCSD